MSSSSWATSSTGGNPVPHIMFAFALVLQAFATPPALEAYLAIQTAHPITVVIFVWVVRATSFGIMVVATVTAIRAPRETTIVRQYVSMATLIAWTVYAMLLVAHLIMPTFFGNVMMGCGAAGLLVEQVYEFGGHVPKAWDAAERALILDAMVFVGWAALFLWGGLGVLVFEEFELLMIVVALTTLLLVKRAVRRMLARRGILVVAIAPALRAPASSSQATSSSGDDPRRWTN